MKKIVVFGAGNFLKNIFPIINLKFKIICITDNNQNLWGTTIFSCNILSPAEAIRTEYDEIIIASNLYRDEIFNQLLSLNVNSDKILHEHELFMLVENNFLEQQKILKYPLKDIFIKQYIKSELNRVDIIVRYLAIEQYYGKNNYGLDLYVKMQNLRKTKMMLNFSVSDHLQSFLILIKSVELTGFSEDMPIRLMSNFHLIDGSHRIAASLYFGIDYIPIKIDSNIRDIDYGYDFFTSDFSEKEIQIIKNKEKEVLDNLFIKDTLKYREFYSNILRLFESEKQKFGRGIFYQSFEKLQIKGQRPTKFRFSIYGLDKFLKKEHEILDIGCNCGFLALHASEYVKHIDGIEFNQALIDVANATKNYLNIKNCDFYCSDFNKFSIDKKYDVIFSFAVHHWIGMSMHEYALKLAGLLNVNGFVVLESQNIKTVDQDFEEKVQEFCGNKFISIYGGEIFDDRKILRKFKILMLK